MITISYYRYYFHRDAMAARDYLNGTKLDDRIIRVDLDPGFEPGRQFGRGATGGQVRDDRRHDYDEGRGGLPPRHKQRIEKHAIAQGQIVGPTNGPINTDTHSHLRHRYEQNMSVNDPKDPKDNKDANKQNKDKDGSNENKEDDTKNKETASSVNNDNDEKTNENKEDEKKQPPNTNTTNDSTTNNGNSHEIKMEVDTEEINDTTNNTTNETTNHTQNGDVKKEEVTINTTSDETKSISSIAQPPSSSEIQEPPLKKQKVET